MAVELSESELRNLDKCIQKQLDLIRLESLHRGQPREETIEKLNKARKVKYLREQELK
jgi:hypothetical protein